MDGRQIQAARVLLGWTQSRTAEAAGVSVSLVKRAEGASKTKASANAIAAIRNALEAAGVEFIPENGGGAGVRITKEGAKNEKE